MANRAVDLVITYRVVKLLATPFEKQEAFKYGIIDKNLSSSKEDLININETIRSIQKDIGKKSDENLSEQNINRAVDLAKLGVGIKEIASKTGFREEQIETLINGLINCL